MLVKNELAMDKQEWQIQMNNFVCTIEQLERNVNLTGEERKVLESNRTTWGTTPYFASLMDRDDLTCPIRRQVIPSSAEQQNIYGMDNYLIWRENRDNEENRPDTIARQYEDRIAFTVNHSCTIYCRHCFLKELVVNKDLKFDFNFEEGLDWISKHTAVHASHLTLCGCDSGVIR